MDESLKHVEWKKPGIKAYTLYDLFTWGSKKVILTYSDKIQINSAWGGLEGIPRKGQQEEHEKSFWDDYM